MKEYSFVPPRIFELVQRTTCTRLSPIQNELELLQQLSRLKSDKLVLAILSARQFRSEREQEQADLRQQLESQRATILKQVEICKLSLEKLQENESAARQQNEATQHAENEKETVAALEQQEKEQKETAQAIEAAAKQAQRVMHPPSPLSGASRKISITKPPPPVLGKNLQAMCDIMNGRRK